MHLRRPYIKRTSSSSSFTAMKDDTAGVISATTGLCSAASNALFHSSTNLPDRASLINVPTRFPEVYASRNRWRASVGGSFAFACTKMSMSTGAPEFFI